MISALNSFQPQQAGRGTRLLHELFEAEARRRPDHTAIEFKEERMSFRDLECEANRIANYLQWRGISVGSLVGIYLKKSPRLYAAILGILKAGAAYVPIDPRFPAERIAAIAEDAELQLIISDVTLSAPLQGTVRTDFLHLDADAELLLQQSAAPVSERLAGAEPSSLCYVIYTSGSTGRPKGVMIEHRNALAFAASLETVYEISETDRIYQGFSTAFDASVEEIWAAFSRGATLVVPTEDVERSPADVAAFINDRKITYFSTVPTLLAMIDDALPSVKTLVLGGEACSAELVSRWAIPGRRMLNTYGPTEATVVATWSECVAGEPVSIGQALPGYTAHVLAPDLTPVAPGETGELYIGGAGVARGYRNLEAMTAERFIPNPFGPEGSRLYRTFDHVRLGSCGNLYFLGRLDDQVKLRGFRIELSEIEAVLMEHPKINAAVVAVHSDGERKDLAAYVVATCAPAELPREEIVALLRSRVPNYMVPQFLDVLDTLPMMSSGKADRKSLPKPVVPLIGASTIVAPESAMERRIAKVIASVFRADQVSVEADFFLDLGGHSLLAAQTVSQLRGAVAGAAVSVRDVYEYRTIRALASVLEERAGAAGEDETQPNGARTAPLPLPAEEAFASVHPLMRWTTVAVQALAAVLFYGIVSAPIAYAAIMVTAVVDGKATWVWAAQTSTIVGFLVWPASLLLSIALKWIVIGRYQAGRYPLWGSYYLRWWLVTRFQALSWSSMFSGTPLMSLYWRAMGAKIGRNVLLRTSHCYAFDMISIGDGTSVGVETQLLGCRVEDGYLVIGPTEIGRDCFVGMHCAIGLDTKLGDKACLDDMSMLLDGATLETGEMRRGAPARKMHVPLPEPVAPAGRFKSAAFGVMHLLLIYAMGYFLIATTIPSFTIVVVGLAYAGIPGGIAGVFLAAPVGLITYAGATVILKGLLGRVKPGTCRVFSFSYLRHWFLAYLLENTKTILMPVYATLYLPPFMRLLGAKIGRGAEVSTVSHVMPDLLKVGEGSFLADACLVGGERIYRGTVDFGRVTVGSRSFIGNSAFVPAGTSIGDDVLIGVSSTPPAGISDVPDNSLWLGSPGFQLPRMQRDASFADDEIFRPSGWAVFQRLITDTLRVLLPSLVFGLNTLAIALLSAEAFRVLPLSAVVLAVPLLATCLALISLVVAATIKIMFIGYVGPIVRPLWSRFVWNNELVNGVYEGVAAPIMVPLMGSPLIAPCLRMMGVKVGSWCFIDTTLFSEFDLVEIGDHASLNMGATIQTHLFEDRVFKADRLKIGAGCSVGNMGVVLYSTEMGDGSRLLPLSVLMKGEVLPERTAWYGNPCEELKPCACRVKPTNVQKLDFSISRAQTKVASGGPSRLVIEPLVAHVA